MNGEENIDQAGDMGVELTEAERDLIQRTRNAGGAQKVMERLAQTPAPPAQPKVPVMTPQEVAAQAQFAAETVVAARDLKQTLQNTAAKFEDLKLDPTDLKQIEATASTSLRERPDYADIKKGGMERLNQVFAEEVEKECKRRAEKTSTKTAEGAKAEAEERLANQAKATEAGTGTGQQTARSAAPSRGAVGLDSIDERVFGTSAEWPSSEMAFLNECRSADEEFIEKRMGRPAKR